VGSGSVWAGASVPTGEALIAPSVTVRLLRAFADIPVGRPAAQPISPVTVREEEVLLAVAPVTEAGTGRAA
jgi:hypothetical protein